MSETVDRLRAQLDLSEQLSQSAHVLVQREDLRIMLDSLDSDARLARIAERATAIYCAIQHRTPIEHWSASEWNTAYSLAAAGESAHARIAASSPEPKGETP